MIDLLAVMAMVESANNTASKKGELLKRLEHGLVPDDEIKQLMRIELERRLQWGYQPTHQQQLAQILHLVHSLRQMNMANEIETLDSQVYEVPMSFLKIMFGSTLKESCCYFENDSTTLDKAEIAMLELYCERAQIRDGQSVLDIGCGQGSLSLYIAQRYKNCHVRALTNSVSQTDYIKDQCTLYNLSNVEVILADITTYEANHTFDRILAIGLVEHMKNYQLLFRMISGWMSQNGLLFVDHICHKTFAYSYELLDEDDWFTDYVFPAGTIIIPSASFLLYFQEDVSVVNHWIVSGKHSARTHEEWLKRIDAEIDNIQAMFEASLGSEEAALKSINYWRGFCLSGMELFGYNNGEEWMTSHVLLKKK